MRDPTRTALVAAVTLMLLGSCSQIADAAPQHRHHAHGQEQGQQDQGDTAVPDPDDSDLQPGDTPENMPQVIPPVPSTGVDGLSNQGPAQTVSIQLTGYARADNTPANSTTISMPVIHQQAGGTCTYKDPTTFASPGSAGSTEFPRGERVYIPKLKCIGISEDSGATKESVKHIDFYVGNGPASETGPCEDDITGPTTVIVNPPPNEPVIVGEIATASGCRVSGGGDDSDAQPDSNTGTSKRAHKSKTKAAQDDSTGDDGGS